MHPHQPMAIQSITGPLHCIQTANLVMIIVSPFSGMLKSQHPSHEFPAGPAACEVHVEKYKCKINNNVIVETFKGNQSQEHLGLENVRENIYQDIIINETLETTKRWKIFKCNTQEIRWYREYHVKHAHLLEEKQYFIHFSSYDFFTFFGQNKREMLWN